MALPQMRTVVGELQFVIDLGYFLETSKGEFYYLEMLDPDDLIGKQVIVTGRADASNYIAVSQIRPLGFRRLFRRWLSGKREQKKPIRTAF